MRLSKFARKVNNSIISRQLFGENDFIGLGVSGGPDSLAMLYALLEIKEAEQKNWRFHILHLDHGYRGEASVQDAKFVAELARSRSIDFSSAKKEDIVYQCEGTSLEEHFRCARYAFYALKAKELNLSAVAVGHNSGDLAETILANILRGTGLKGLAGMPIKRPLLDENPCLVVRPLLDCSRDEIVSYLQERKLVWREDETNRSTAFTRNRIRRILLPQLQDFNPSVNDVLLSLGRQAQSANDLIESMSEKILLGNLVELSPDKLVFKRAMLTGDNDVLSGEALKKALKKLHGSVAGFGEKHFRSVIELAQGPTPNAVLPLVHGLHVRRSYDEIIIQTGPVTPTPATKDWTTNLSMEALTILPDGRKISASFVTGEEAREAVQIRQNSSTKASGEEYFDFQTLTLPLTLRNVRAGDRYRPIGFTARGKKVARMMLDAHFPLELRRNAFVLESGGQIVWALDFPPAEECKITDATTQALRLRFEI